MDNTDAHRIGQRFEHLNGVGDYFVSGQPCAHCAYCLSVHDSGKTV
jgi:hypothetical protein